MKTKAMNVTEKILSAHLVEGDPAVDRELGIKIDQTLTQDATGTMAYLQFESMGVPRVKTDVSVSYVDHNTVQIGFENADDHDFLQSIAKKYGIIYSKAGNGICHQLHLERYGKPGTTLLGSDSHTPTGGGIGQIAIGAAICCSASAWAASEFIDGNGLKWTYTASSGKATLSNVVKADGSALTGTLTIPATINGATVTAIGANAFQNLGITMRR